MIALDLTYVSNGRILVKWIEIFGVVLEATNDSLRHAYAQNHDLPLIFSWSQNNQNKSNIEETQWDPSQEIEGMKVIKIILLLPIFK